MVEEIPEGFHEVDSPDYFKLVKEVPLNVLEEELRRRKKEALEEARLILLKEEQVPIVDFPDDALNSPGKEVKSKIIQVVKLLEDRESGPFTDEVLHSIPGLEIFVNVSILTWRMAVIRGISYRDGWPNRLAFEPKDRSKIAVTYEQFGRSISPYGWSDPGKLKNPSSNIFKLVLPLDFSKTVLKDVYWYDRTERGLNFIYRLASVPENPWMRSGLRVGITPNFGNRDEMGYFGESYEDSLNRVQKFIEESIRASL